MFLLSRHLSLGRTWCVRVSFALLSGFITGAKQGDGQAQRERERRDVCLNLLMRNFCIFKSLAMYF